MQNRDRGEPLYFPNKQYASLEDIEIEMEKYEEVKDDLDKMKSTPIRILSSSDIYVGGNSEWTSLHMWVSF